MHVLTVLLLACLQEKKIHFGNIEGSLQALLYVTTRYIMITSTTIAIAIIIAKKIYIF